MKTIISNFIYRNENFVIVENDGYYLAINRRELDKDGKLTKQLNGLQMHASDKLNITLDNVMNALDIKAHGFTSEDLANKPNLLLDIVNGKYRS